MNKVINFLQKYIGYIALLGFALLTIYAFGMATASAGFRRCEDTENFYKDIMPYNNLILILSIVGLIFSALYMVLRNNKRPIYYVSNFISMFISILFTFVSSVLTIVGVSFYQNKFNTLVNSPEFEDYYQIIVQRDGSINKNTPTFILGYLIAILLVLIAICYVVVLAFKIADRLRYENNKKNGVCNPVTYIPVKNNADEAESNDEMLTAEGDNQDGE